MAFYLLIYKYLFFKAGEKVILKQEFLLQLFFIGFLRMIAAKMIRYDNRQRYF